MRRSPYPTALAFDRGCGRAPLLARGTLSAQLLWVLTEEPQPVPQLRTQALDLVGSTADVLRDDDVQLSLLVLHELHHRGWPGVDDRWEWHPDLVGLAAVLEDATEAGLRALVADRLPDAPAPRDVPTALAELVQGDDGPSMSRYLARTGTVTEYREHLVHRSIYHLKEADPHTWAIPRLAGRAKAALVEIQADEYGAGRAEWMHATLYGDTMRGLGLDDSYGHHLNDVPAITLAWANTMTLFGLHRRLLGAAIGHLAALEMSSSLPMRRYGNGLRRLGFDEPTTRFFDEHIEADAVHEQIAAHDVAGQLALDRPALVEDILFGAAVALAIDAAVTTHVLDSWAAGRSSLRPIPENAAGVVSAAAALRQETKG
ncbi:Iron-containing redox enzyme [Friedmanniella luteola]|uniref:Iron-containing redox enzyme n=1 Tax=Friedmanniella luteola TaxID=546871 RepID=A0A1H1S5H2_9ACTN|nr:iron-containing redox enzyme family protein [Friedmanniella luteola]SDS43018.1 Iron-containing redox enzyme [Friedmanniella luteola]